jgi:hypothetical protein
LLSFERINLVLKLLHTPPKAQCHLPQVDLASRQVGGNFVR